MHAEAGAVGEREHAGSGRLALALLWLTLAWNVGEGAVAVGSGLTAGSVALVGFGLDSFIEVVAAAVLLWRLHLPDERGGGRTVDSGQWTACPYHGA